MATLIRYPLDPTGVNPNNKVLNEPHTLQNRTIRVVAPSYGAFFTESLVIKDVTNNNVTLTSTQFKAVELYEFPSGRYGKEICGVILITDVSVSNNISISYQALGGDYSTNTDAIVAMLNTIDLDNRPVSWPNLIGKPAQFVPAMHYHDIGDVYGFEYVVHAIERLRMAVLAGDDTTHDEILRYIDQWGNSLSGGNGNIVAQLNAHVLNTNNPHSTTKSQVGLGNVDNYATATTAEAQNGVVTTKFMTPNLVASAIATQAAALVNAHANNVNNPHATSKTQVGLSLVDNFSTASNVTTAAGTSTNTFVTPAGVAAAITAQATPLVTAHSSRVDNPHSTTKAQVGLSNVQNYAIATTLEAQTGTSNVVYMTPSMTTTAITKQRDNGLFDTRYAPLASAVSCSLQVVAGQLQAYVAGAWRIVWPPQWQA